MIFNWNFLVYSIAYLINFIKKALTWNGLVYFIVYIIIKINYIFYSMDREKNPINYNLIEFD